MADFIIAVTPNKADMIQALRYKMHMGRCGMNVAGISLNGADERTMPTHIIEDFLDLKVIDDHSGGLKVFPPLTRDMLKVLMVRA